MKDSDVTEISRSDKNRYPIERLCLDNEPTLGIESQVKESKQTRDTEELARYGKRQQLKASGIYQCVMFSLIHFADFISRETLSFYQSLG